MNRFLIALALFISVQSSAQVIYNQSNHGIPGENFNKSTTTVVLSPLDFDTTGANYNWDFTTLGFDSQNSFTYLDPDTSGYKTSWTNNCFLECLVCCGNILTCGGLCDAAWDTTSNLAIPRADSVAFFGFEVNNVVDFYNSKSTGLDIRMLGSTIEVLGIPIQFFTKYDDPDVLYKFPVTYGSSYSDSSRYTIDLSGAGVDLIWKHYQSRNNTVDGWGTLNTPYGTFNDVLRISSNIVATDSIWLFGSWTVNDSVVNYEKIWLDTAWGTPVLQVNGNLIGNQVSYNTAEYIDSIRCVPPTALFIGTPLTGQLDGPLDSAEIVFTNLSLNADSVHWDFGDTLSPMNTTNKYSPSHTYHGPGTYIVTLDACNSFCPDSVACSSLTLPVVVVDTTQVVAVMNWSPNTPCQGDTVSFQNLSVNDTAVVWYLGDGDTAMSNDPTHVYTGSGDFQVVLVAMDGAIIDTASETITIAPDPPIADAGPDVYICPGDTAQLNASGVVQGFYNWTPWLDVSCVLLCGPQIEVWPSVTRDYILSTTDICGSSKDTVRVHVDTNVVADFNFVVNGLDVQFTDNSSHAGTQFWEFGDGDTLTASNPMHSYSSPGAYSVCLTVNGSCNSDSVCKTVNPVVSGIQGYSAGVTVQPNPSFGGDIQVISHDAIVSEWTLYSASGTLVSSGTPNSKKFLIKGSSKRKGVYILKLDGIKSVKVVIE